MLSLTYRDWTFTPTLYLDKMDVTDEEDDDFGSLATTNKLYLGTVASYDTGDKAFFDLSHEIYNDRSICNFSDALRLPTGLKTWDDVLNYLTNVFGSVLATEEKIDQLLDEVTGERASNLGPREVEAVARLKNILERLRSAVGELFIRKHDVDSLNNLLRKYGLVADVTPQNVVARMQDLAEVLEGARLEKLDTDAETFFNALSSWSAPETVSFFYSHLANLYEKVFGTVLEIRTRCERTLKECNAERETEAAERDTQLRALKLEHETLVEQLRDRSRELEALKAEYDGMYEKQLLEATARIREECEYAQNETLEDYGNRKSVLEDEYNRLIAQRENEYNDRVYSLDTDAAQKSEELDALKVTLERDYEAKELKFLTESSELRSTINAMTSEGSRLEREVVDLKAQIERLRKDHAEEMRVMSEQFSKETVARESAVKMELQGEMSEQSDEYQARIAQLEKDSIEERRRFEETLSKRTAEHDAALQALQQELYETKKNMTTVTLEIEAAKEVQAQQEAQYGREAERLQRELNEALKQTGDLQRTSESHEGTVRSLQNKLETLQKENEETSKKITELNRTIAENRKVMSDKNSEIERLTDALNTEKDDHDQLRAKADDERKSALEVDKRLFEARQKVSDLQNKLKKLTDEKNTLAHNFETEVQRITDERNTFSSKVAELQSQIEFHLYTINEQEVQIAAMTEQNDACREENKELQEQLLNISKKYENGDVYVKNARKAIIDFVAAMEGAGIDIPTSEDMETEDGYTTELLQFRRVRGKVEERLSESRKREKELISMYDAIAKAGLAPEEAPPRISGTSASQIREYFDALVRSYKTNYAKTESLGERLVDLRKAVSNAVKAIALTSVALSNDDDLNSGEAPYLHALTSLAKVVSKLQKDAEETRLRCDELTDNMKGYENKLNAANNAAETLKIQLGDAERRLDEQAVDSESHRQRIEKLKEQLYHVKEEGRRMTQDINTLHNAVNDANASNAQLVTTNEALEKESARKEARMNEILTEVDALLNFPDTSSSGFAHLSGVVRILNQLNADKSKMQDELRASIRSAEELQRLLKATGENLAQQTNELTTARDDYARTKKQLDETRAQLETAGDNARQLTELKMEKERLENGLEEERRNYAAEKHATEARFKEAMKVAKDNADKLRKEIDTTHSRELANISKEIETQRLEVEKMSTAHRAQLDTLKTNHETRVRELQSEVDRLTALAAERAKQLTVALQQVAELEEEMKTRDKLLDKIQSTSAENIKTLTKKLKTSQSTARDKHTKLSDENALLQKKLEEARDDRAKLSEEYARLKQESRSRADQLSEENARLDKTLGQSRSAADKLSEENALLKTSLKESDLRTAHYLHQVGTQLGKLRTLFVRAGNADAFEKISNAVLTQMGIGGDRSVQPPFQELGELMDSAVRYVEQLRENLENLQSTANKKAKVTEKTSSLLKALDLVKDDLLQTVNETEIRVSEQLKALQFAPECESVAQFRTVGNSVLKTAAELRANLTKWTKGSGSPFPNTRELASIVNSGFSSLSAAFTNLTEADAAIAQAKQRLQSVIGVINREEPLEDAVNRALEAIRCLQRDSMGVLFPNSDADQVRHSIGRLRETWKPAPGLETILLLPFSMLAILTGYNDGKEEQPAPELRELTKQIQDALLKLQSTVQQQGGELAASAAELAQSTERTLHLENELAECIKKSTSLTDTLEAQNGDATVARIKDTTPRALEMLLWLSEFGPADVERFASTVMRLKVGVKDMNLLFSTFNHILESWKTYAGRYPTLFGYLVKIGLIDQGTGVPPAPPKKRRLNELSRAPPLREAPVAYSFVPPGLNEVPVTYDFTSPIYPPATPALLDEQPRPTPTLQTTVEQPDQVIEAAAQVVVEEYDNSSVTKMEMERNKVKFIPSEKAKVAAKTNEDLQPIPRTLYEKQRAARKLALKDKDKPLQSAKKEKKKLIL